METIEMTVECPVCNGAGIYSGEGEGIAVGIICLECKGTGAYEYKYNYNKFTGRRNRTDIERVYKAGSNYKLGTGVINFKGIGEIDMSNEGVSYDEFVAGKMPEHIKSLDCPMSADQGACHELDGFVDECMRLNGGWIGTITSCKYQCNKSECWSRFDNQKGLPSD